MVMVVVVVVIVVVVVLIETTIYIFILINIILRNAKIDLGDCYKNANLHNNNIDIIVV